MIRLIADCYKLKLKISVFSLPRTLKYGTFKLSLWLNQLLSYHQQAEKERGKNEFIILSKLHFTYVDLRNMIYFSEILDLFPVRY